LKSSRVQLSLGPTVWVELSLGLNVGGLNVKAQKMGVTIQLRVVVKG
jgi:hypothetical protein